MAEGRTAEACPKLEESQRLDPSGGTILNLALCHEREGRLARAWSEFNDAAVTARRDGRGDRETDAANHVHELEPRLSRLTIVVPMEARAEGLVIERDGRPLGEGAWSTALPIDGGEHLVRATARGRDPFVARIVVAQESDTQIVEIPVLATPVVVVPPQWHTAAVEIVATPKGPTAATLRRVALGTAALGVVLLGSAGYALKSALVARDEATPHCWMDGCDETGVRRRQDAVHRGNLATVLGIGGAVLVGGGTALFLVSRSPHAGRDGGRIATPLVLGGGPGNLMVGLEGGF